MRGAIVDLTVSICGGVGRISTCDHHDLAEIAEVGLKGLLELQGLVYRVRKFRGRGNGESSPIHFREVVRPIETDVGEVGDVGGAALAGIGDDGAVCRAGIADDDQIGRSRVLRGGSIPDILDIGFDSGSRIGDGSGRPDGDDSDCDTLLDLPVHKGLKCGGVGHRAEDQHLGGGAVQVQAFTLFLVPVKDSAAIEPVPLHRGGAVHEFRGGDEIRIVKSDPDLRLVGDLDIPGDGVVGDGFKDDLKDPYAAHKADLIDREELIGAHAVALVGGGLELERHLGGVFGFGDRSLSRDDPVLKLELSRGEILGLAGDKAVIDSSADWDDDQFPQGGELRLSNSVAKSIVIYGKLIKSTGFGLHGI